MFRTDIATALLSTLISSILRLPYLHGLNQSSDPTWSVVNIVMWSLAELGSAISLSSIPAIRPLYAHIFLKKGPDGRPARRAGARGDATVPRPKKTGASNLPFSLGTIGSIADRSAWRPHIQMFTLRSDCGHETQMGSQLSESQSRIVADDEAGISTEIDKTPQNSTSTTAAAVGSVDGKNAIPLIASPQPAATRT